jgi:diacylglycerol diphosphate phosphatase / phosphatidate phosphatase
MAKHRQKPNQLPIFIYFLAALPPTGALLVAISRVDDYWHHWQDVTVGAIIGIVFAVLSFNQYFYQLGSDNSGKARCHIPGYEAKDEILDSNYTLEAVPSSPALVV